MVTGPLPFAGDDPDAQRCADAAATSGRAAELPDRAAWTGGAQLTRGGDVVLSTTDGLLCRATPTTVYLSEPSARRAVVGLGPGTVEVTVPAGSAVGVTSSSGVRTGLAAVNPDGSAQLLTFPADSYPATVSASVQLFGESSTSTVTAADTPGALVVVDRPIPPADRTDPDGALLDECLAAEPQPIPDADAYRALGRLELPDGTVTVRALAYGHAALCVQKDGRAALLALSTMYRFADGRLVVELERSVGADRVALLAVDPLATTVEADVDVGTRRPCRVESGVAFCLYESGGDPTVFVTRNAAGDIVGTGNP